MTLDDDFYGTYRNVGSSRRVLDTGEVIPGGPQNGYITYSRDGRMLVVIAQGTRERPASVEAMTDAQRVALFKSVIAYGGTFEFDGEVMKHHIDLSWNEVWTGTTQIRDVRRDGGRLIYTTRPAPSPEDGRMSVSTIVWEKAK